ncbi:MAG: dienelactone hydrolase family protein [Deltaproteobacteria bacterium]|nr:dienelactone hydrolase family protein [Deltaproteobacteria bacterium]MBW2413269.1 dienelactone hydrolase family protein [Deltaproteobacteria bacterium]
MFIGEAVSARGVSERGYVLRAGARDVPGVLWMPEDAIGPRPLVLLGHGGSGHKRQDYITSMARRVVRHLGYAATAIDGPAHGDRAPDDMGASIEEARRRWWRKRHTDEMIEDWKATIDALQKLDGVGVAPVGYWGLSMGTIFGLPFVAAEPRVCVAVLGLMGVMGPTGDRLEEDAARVHCPVLFLLQWHDELVERASAQHLFDRIASPDKRLHANPGKHVDVPFEEFDASEAFLQRHLAVSPPAA